jgi:protein SCO1/2
MVATPEGVLSRYLYGIEYITRDLRLALVEASRGEIGSLVDQVLLLCYHYDPTTGRYGLAIMAALRAGGMATVGLIIGFVLLSLRRERRARRSAQSGAIGG